MNGILSYRAGRYMAGAAAGGALMYLLDPRSGRTRRAHLRDQAVRSVNMAKETGDEALRDLRNRTQGMAAELWGSIWRGPVPDDVLVDRVRARLGRLVSHPRALEVEARNGVVRLQGAILEHEVEEAVSGVCSVRGVCDADTSQLEVHKEADNVPALQGGKGVRRPRPDFLQENWAPATRVLVGAAAAAALAAGARQRYVGPILMLGGAAALLRAVMNQPVGRALGFSGGRRGIEFQKTIEVNAPLDEVYGMWANPENFPRIMSHVREVKGTGKHYRWVIGGPAGLSVSWNAVTTENVPNRVIAWKSATGSLIRNAGIVRFDPTADGRTRIQLRMSYNPVGGAIAHALAVLLGSDPKRILDEDLVRFKSLLEEGKTTAKGETVTREQLSA